jgi:hypothetical protein
MSTHPTPLAEKIAAIEKALKPRSFCSCDGCRAINEGRDALAALAKDVAAMEEALKRIPALGHSDDCVLCAFKDKEALKALGIDPKEHIAALAAAAKGQGTVTT